MKTRELTVDKWLDHLKRHPLPELMDEECLKALENVRVEYGSAISHGAGLEVRLGSEDRYIDYIMNIDTEEIPLIGSLWYELDYAAFKNVDVGQEETIIPCYFANITAIGAESYDDVWDKVLPPMMGERRASLLRAPLDRVVAALPEGADIKQIGSMSSRGELDIMRLVIMFPSWDVIPEGLSAIGWQGDKEALRDALKPWAEDGKAAVNIDLGEKGVLPKIGVETASRWRHPVLMDKFITRLVEEGLCLPEKAEALKRWIRLRPGSDPFIQTLIAYYKLNYKDGKITEAKAYLEQSPYIHHNYFNAYEYPERLDIELSNEETTLPEERAASFILEGDNNNIQHFRFYGEKDPEKLQRLLELCKGRNKRSEVVLSGINIKEALFKAAKESADSVLVDLTGEEIPADIEAFLSPDSGNISLRFPMRHDNGWILKDLIDVAARYGVRELIITESKVAKEGNTPDLKDYEVIRELFENTGSGLTVDSCFSSLRAFLGGEDIRHNPNRGIEKGCMAGRAFFAIRSDGSFTPCLNVEGNRAPVDFSEYWEELVTGLSGEEPGSCDYCRYRLRCLPCPAGSQVTEECPLANI